MQIGIDRKGFDEILKDLVQLGSGFRSFKIEIKNSDVAIQNHHSHDPVFPHYSYGQNAIKFLIEKHNPKLAINSNTVDPRLILKSALIGYWGFCTSKKGKLPAAIEKYDASLELYPDNLLHYARRGLLRATTFKEKV